VGYEVDWHVPAAIRSTCCLLLGSPRDCFNGISLYWMKRAMLLIY
jgi:hypothetical protein